MPTPGGKLKKGDILLNTKTGAYWRVIERVGNDELYAVKLTPCEDKDWRPDDRRRGYMLMTEAAYWLTQGWQVTRKIGGL